MVVWSQSLASVALNDARAVPAFLEKCFKFIIDKCLDTEGIFRVPGKETEIKDFISTIDAIGNITINNDTSPYAICNLITRFFRDIPGHVMLDKNANALQNCKTPEEIKAIVKTLPIINKTVLSRFIAFMTIVAKHSEQNRMTQMNIAIILSPILVDDPNNPMFIFSKDVINMILENYSMIFDSVLALDENGEWLSDEEFSESIGCVVNAFFCQSSIMLKQLTPIKVVKQARMVRNVVVDVSDWKSMMNSLLEINPQVHQSNVIPQTKL